MAATLKSISSKKATVHVPVDPTEPDGDKVRVVYRPRAVTGTLASELRDKIGTDANLAAFAVPEMNRALICATVVEWDLRADADDSDPIPLTDEGLKQVPTVFLEEILEAIREDQAPDPKAKN